MKRDNIKDILGETATEEQITNLLNAFHNSEKAKNDEIANLRAENSRYSDYDSIKMQLDEINKSKMTEQEKLEAERKDIELQKKEINKIYNTAKAKEILTGIAIPDKVLERMVNGTLDETIELANLYKESMTITKENIVKETKESLINVDLKPSISNVNPNEEVMNFEKFSKLSAEEQEKFINEHPEEFEKL